MTDRPRLTRLRVENLALIQEAELQLADGLTSIVGETGAGKTMLSKSLDLLLGAKTPKGVVRPGAQSAYIEATFALPDDWGGEGEIGEILEDAAGELVLARRIAAAGRSRCLAGGRTVSLDTLRELSGRLIAFYGQHEGRGLVLEAVQTRLLDGSGDAGGLALADSYSQCRRQALRAQARLQALEQAQAQDIRALDLARYELQELQELDPQVGEEERLHAELRRLAGAVDGAQACSAAQELLHGEQGGALDGVGTAARLLADVGGPVDELAARLDGIQSELQDIGADLARLAEGWEADPQRQAQVEARLGALLTLARKHGVAADELPAVQVRLQAQVAAADDGPRMLQQAQQEAAEALAEATRAADQLSRWRGRQAPQLARRVSAVLGELAMEGATFSVELQPLAGSGLQALGPGGAEQVVFVLQANPGLPAEPLSQVASGGEVSRLMLALIAEARPGDQALLVLDEPDSGLGGQTAHGVAARLQALAAESQVLVISHLPQLAARANRLLKLEKATDGQATVTRVLALDSEEQIVAELCRMAGHPPDDPAARKVARQLRARR